MEEDNDIYISMINIVIFILTAVNLLSSKDYGESMKHVFKKKERGFQSPGLRSSFYKKKLGYMRNAFLKQYIISRVKIEPQKKQIKK